MAAEQSFACEPALWTFNDVPRNRFDRSMVEAWKRPALVVADVVADLAGKPPDIAFPAALKRLSRKPFRELLQTRLSPGHSEKAEGTFTKRRVTPLRLAYGLDAFDPREDSLRARVLLLHAAEYSFVPFAEGALAAIKWSPSIARWDIRTGFHTVARWAFDHDPGLAVLAAASLTIDGSSLPWRPFTQFYELVLRPHRLDDDRRRADADGLSLHTIGTLLDANRAGSRQGEVVRNLMTHAESLGVLPPRPRFERDEHARRQSELTRILLDFEIGRALGDSADDILDVIEAERAGAEG